MNHHCKCNYINIGSETVFMKRVVCLYIPEPLVRGYKTRNEFHKKSYEMKNHYRFFS